MNTSSNEIKTTDHLTSELRAMLACIISDVIGLGVSIDGQADHILLHVPLCRAADNALRTDEIIGKASYRFELAGYNPLTVRCFGYALTNLASAVIRDKDGIPKDTAWVLDIRLTKLHRVAIPQLYGAGLTCDNGTWTAKAQASPTVQRDYPSIAASIGLAAFNPLVSWTRYREGTNKLSEQLAGTVQAPQEGVEGYTALMEVHKTILSMLINTKDKEYIYGDFDVIMTTEMNTSVMLPEKITYTFSRSKAAAVATKSK